MVYTTYLWWFGGCFIFVLPTLLVVFHNALSLFADHIMLPVIQWFGGHDLHVWYDTHFQAIFAVLVAFTSKYP
jgi:hypothetical protein